MNTKPVQILSIDAKDLYGANIIGNDYSVKTKNGDINFKKYINTLDFSLDLLKLRDVYYKKYRKLDFGFVNPDKKKGIADKDYTNQVVNVTFNYSYKEYNKCNRNVFVKNGYNIRDLEFVDSICVRDGEILAIELNRPIENNQIADIDCKYFEYDVDVDNETGEVKSQTYKAAKNIKTLMNIKKLREHLYVNGFTIDGVRYVRWKRSSGSARVGKCLFINEQLFKGIHKWDLCGLKVKTGQNIDLAAFEGAVSLSLSSIVDTVEIKPEEILIIDDYDSVFEDTVAGVTLQDGWLKCEPQKSTVSNSIWDGQALLDTSVFGEKYSNRGMLLLRNRFFKSCGFHTDIQKWFRDNDITDVSQLNGFTLATDVSQIKIITTPNSIKYMKFGTLEEWLNNINSRFGVVKYDKPTQYFDGRMVQIHYQLLNTLQLSYKDMEEFLQPTLDYIDLIRNDPATLRYYIKYPYQNIDDLSYNSKNDIVFALLGLNENFTKTKYYQDFKTDLITSIIKNLRRGHVLVRGTYATLFGNGLEMLKSSIRKFEGESEIGVANIYSKMFADGQEVLGTRSPHIVSGNVYLATNRKLKEFDEYFKLSREIVCVNAICENIQQRANGCDYDSDTFALTDCELLIERAKQNYHKFLVPTSFVQAEKTQRTYTDEQFADLDMKTSINKIGEVVNESQELNSLLWDKVHKGESIEDNIELYYDICILAVLSGIEIDKAKKEYLVNSGKEIEKLKIKYKLTDEKTNKTRKPMFFKMITIENGYSLNQKNKYDYWNTPMDYLQKKVGKYCHKYRGGKNEKSCSMPFSSIIRPLDRLRTIPPDHDRVDAIVDVLRDFSVEIKNIYTGEFYPHERWVKINYVKERREEYMCGLDVNKRVAYLLLKLVDNKEYRDIRNYVLQILFGLKNSAFFKLVAESQDAIEVLKECPNGEIKVYDYNFCRKTR